MGDSPRDSKNDQTSPHRELEGREGRDPGTLAPPTATNLTKAEIEQVASAVAKQLDYKPATELAGIVEEKLGGQVVFLDVNVWLEEGCDVIEVWGPKDFAIYLSKVAGMLRNRFTIAHELGHYFLHARLGSQPLRASRSGVDERSEWEANWFAASLLMPEEMFADIAQKNSSPDYLAAAFLVSPMAAEVRKKTLGIH